MNLEKIINDLKQGYDVDLEKRIIQEIISHDIDKLDDDLADILAFAISEHFNELALTILKKDFNGKQIELEQLNQAIIDQSKDKYSLLHFTAQFGNKEMLLYFLKNGVKISFDKDNLSPIHILVHSKNLNKNDYKKILEEFIAIEPNIVNHRCVYDLTALHYAAHQDNRNALEALLSFGAKT